MVSDGNATVGEEAPSRLYLDNAATSYPKPTAVYDAMDAFLRANGASCRGRFAEAREAGALVRRCRERLVELVNGESPDHVVFTYNTTDALNLAIHGLVSRRRHTQPNRPIHLITTRLDHNSVLRPFNDLAEDKVEQTRLPSDARTGVVDPEQVRAAIRPDTLLVAVNHASNVTGVIQSIEKIGRICREARVTFLVDAAQSLGHIPVDVHAASIDLLAFPGHKGLLGPTGTGGLYIRPGVESMLRPVRQGGTGSRSEEDVQPTMVPDRFEPGSPNTVGIIGLSEGIGYLLERTIADVRKHEIELMEPILDAVRKGAFKGLRLLGPKTAAERVGVFSFVHDRLAPTVIADALEQRFGILTRAGLHCAPLAHQQEGTAPPHGQGAVRLSLGPFVTQQDVEYTIRALREVCAAMAVAVKPVVRLGTIAR